MFCDDGVAHLAHGHAELLPVSDVRITCELPLTAQMDPTFITVAVHASEMFLARAGAHAEMFL